MANELTGNLDTDESSQRATPIGMEQASGDATFSTDQEFLTADDPILDEYLHISGGLFSLENDVDFGATGGLARS